MSRHAIIALTRRMGPMTAKQLAAELRICESSVRTSICRARAHGTQHIRIAAWAMDVAKYGPGPGEDEPGGSTIDLVLAHLEDGVTATVAQLASALGCTPKSVDSAIRRLRAKPGGNVIRIAGWSLARGHSGRESPIYEFGRSADAKRPDFSQAQRQAEVRYNIKRRTIAVMAKRLVAAA